MQNSPSHWLGKPYYSLNAYFRKTFGRRIHRLPLDAGFDCPNRDGTLSQGGCIYCGENGSGARGIISGKSITEQLSERSRKIHLPEDSGFIAYFQAFTNTYAPVEKLEALYREALAFPGVVGIAIGTRPDCVSPEVLELLDQLGREHWVLLELGVQTLKDETLTLVRRGHDSQTSTRTLNAALRHPNIHTLCHLILGLPGETPGDMERSLKGVLLPGLHGLKLHHLMVEKNTELERLYLQGGFTLQTRESYLETLCRLIPEIPPDIVLHRLFGDSHADCLVAPKWTLEKLKNLTELETMLRSRGLFQGGSVPEKGED